MESLRSGDKMAGTWLEQPCLTLTTEAFVDTKLQHTPSGGECRILISDTHNNRFVGYDLRTDRISTRQRIIILQVSVVVFRVGRAARHLEMAKMQHCPAASHPPRHEHRVPLQPQRKDPERFRGRRC